MSLALTSRKAALLAPWQRNPLWAAARAVPSLDLRFAESKSLVDATTGQNLVTFTRASEATFVNSQGQIQTAANNAPRFDHNPSTGESLGLLVEEQRQNLLLNSGTLSTQNVTVTAVAHTLSFTGTGTITLSGTSTAGPLVGTGTGAANRVSLTFTPTAGTLTLTVSGTVTNAQLEIGSFRTSYIPTLGTAATRAADAASISGSNLTSWFNASFGTVFCGTSALRNASGVVYGFGNTFDNTLYATTGSSNNVFVRSGGAVTASLTAPISASSVSRSAVAYQLDNFAAVSDGGTVSTDTSGAVPVSPVRFKIGSSAWDASASNIPNGHISRLTYWPQRLGNEVLQRITQ